MPNHLAPNKVLVPVRITKEEREALDAFRRNQKNPPSRAAAARLLLLKGLNTHNQLAAGPGL